jgi:ribosomal protein S18 acetylase RimI-like enzyme
LFDFYEDSDDYITLRLPVHRAETLTEAKLKDFVDTHKISELDIREAEKGDIAIINDIYNKSWKESHLPMKKVTEELFIEIYEDPDTRFLIAMFNEVPVGFILMEFSKTDKEIGLISGLAILPEYQNRGFGKYLAHATWNYFKKQNIKELRCEVYKENQHALKFIKALGFEEYGTGGELYPLK